MAGEYDIFGLELIFKDPKQMISQTIWLKLGRWNYGDQPPRHRNVQAESNYKHSVSGRLKHLT